MNRPDREKSYNKRAFRIVLIGIFTMVLAATGTALLFTYMMRVYNSIETDGQDVYKAHYAFIVDAEDEEFWNDVYRYASKRAAEESIYVEDMAKSLGVHYSSEDYLRVAINSSVDGIIYGGTVTEAVETMINESVEKGIPVVLLQNDAESTLRQCFIGVNHYELGQVYASQIAELIDINDVEGKKVEIFVDDDITESTTNILTIAIEDYFAENKPDYKIPEIIFTRISSDDVFSVEEDIRNFFLKRKILPDIILCLNSIYTECSYQAIVDYNRVGDTQIIGYFVNNNILEAVEKHIIFSTISIDTAQMGESAVDSLIEYNEVGYTNSYISVSTSVIDATEARRIINESK